ncbi:MAG: hypothetical protein HY057_14365 [Rhodospirillales bacterium]|nr:hypothetical protein [Rhodospirillales bacterium]
MNERPKRDQITIREGERFWPLLSLMMDTHIDDLSNDRLERLEAMVREWQITHADGSRLELSDRWPIKAAPLNPATIEKIKVRGVARLFDEPSTLLLILNRRATDDELREFHDFLRTRRRATDG